jgi:hypothetical protein
MRCDFQRDFYVGGTDPGRRSGAVGGAPSQWRAAAGGLLGGRTHFKPGHFDFQNHHSGGSKPRPEPQKEEEHDPTGGPVNPLA